MRFLIYCTPSKRVPMRWKRERIIYFVRKYKYPVFWVGVFCPQKYFCGVFRNDGIQYLKRPVFSYRLRPFPDKFRSVNRFKDRSLFPPLPPADNAPWTRFVNFSGCKRFMIFCFWRVFMPSDICRKNKVNTGKIIWHFEGLKGALIIIISWLLHQTALGLRD